MTTTREEYNNCLKPWISGKGIPKEERRVNFCIGAKLCSGKVKDENEARAICSVPKLPKWAKEILPVDTSPITCKDRSKRDKEAVSTIINKINTGAAEETRPLAAQLMNDIFTCHQKTGLPELISDTMKEFNELSKRMYLRAEGKEIQKGLETIKELL